MLQHLEKIETCNMQAKFIYFAYFAPQRNNTDVVYFEQLLGAARTQNWLKLEKALKWTKKVEKPLKKMFRPAFVCTQHQKAGRNTQHT